MGKIITSKTERDAMREKAEHCIIRRLVGGYGPEYIAKLIRGTLDLEDSDEVYRQDVYIPSINNVYTLTIGRRVSRYSRASDYYHWGYSKVMSYEEFMRAVPKIEQAVVARFLNRFRTPNPEPKIDIGLYRKIAKNKIIVALWRSQKVRDFLRKANRLPTLFEVQNISQVFDFCNKWMEHRAWIGGKKYSVDILGFKFASTTYASDEMNGICEKSDIFSYRYKNMERDGKVFKMRIGKMYRHIIDNNEFGAILPEQVKLYLCEEMTRLWSAHVASKFPDYELKVDDDFYYIYSGNNYAGEFHSCMTGRGFESFYNDSVKASAASINNKDGKILARCVIFNEVHDVENQRVLRLAERQYASGGDDFLKMLLVKALIDGGYIDGYKKIGAGCGDTHAWCDKDGGSLDCGELWIHCNVQHGGYAPYQDSFKWYDMHSGKASNDDDCYYTHVLDSTSGYISSWDDYHEEYVDSEVITVSYHGNEITCSEDWLEDFVWIDSEDMYFHEDDVTQCSNCNDYFVDGDGYYSELTGEYYCCEDCMCNAEQDYKESNWEYSDFDEDYFEEVVSYWGHDGDGEYSEYTISIGSLNREVQSGRIRNIADTYIEVSEYMDRFVESM